MSSTNGQPSVERVNAALDIAELSARNGLWSLSMQAVQRALKFGPPTVSTNRRAAEIVHRGARVDTISPVAPSQLDAILDRIPRTIFKLSSLWQDHVDPADAYQTLRDIVLVGDTGGTVQMYTLPLRIDPLQPDRLPSAQSVAQELIRWAVKAGRLDNLLSDMQQTDDANSVEGALLVLMGAIETDDAQLLAQQTHALYQQMKSGATQQAAELVAFVGMTLARKGQYPTASAQLLEAAGQTLAGIHLLHPQPNSPARAVLLAAARGYFDIDQPDRAISLLQQYLAVQVRGKYGIASAGLRERQEEVVGRELFRRGLVKEATDLLGPDMLARFERRYRLTTPGSTVNTQIGDSNPAAFTNKRIVPGDEIDAAEIANQIWFCRLDTESQSSDVLFRLPDFANAASPAVAPNGNQVAFSASLPGEAVTSDAKLYVASFEGHRLQCLGRGTLPSWSPEGKRIAFSSYSPDRGVWVARGDGSDRRLIDETGWGGCWSPDGRMIAYTKLLDRRWDFVIYDMVEDEYRSLFQKQSATFATIFDGFHWSANSSDILFRATHDVASSITQTQQLIGLSVPMHGMRDPEFRRHGTISSNFAWRGSLQSPVITTKRSANGSTEVLVSQPLSEASPSQVVSGQFLNRRNTQSAWTPDGDALIYISKPKR